jgi:hypothetical protein
MSKELLRKNAKKRLNGGILFVKKNVKEREDKFLKMRLFWYHSLHYSQILL